MDSRATVISICVALLLAAGCGGGLAPSAAPSGPSVTAPTVTPSATLSAAPSPAPSPSQPSSPSASTQAVVGAGEEWVVFQSLADQFDPTADKDGIDHDDTIFLIRTDGSGLHRLPPESMVGSEIRPRWSHDGQRVAFVRGHLPNEGGDLWMINADGGGAQRIYSCVQPCNTIGNPDWSPDGKSIYFDQDSNAPPSGGPPLTFEKWEYDLTTGQARPVLRRDHDRSAELTQVSPDGTRVVYVGGRDVSSEAGDSALFVADIDGANERRITDWGIHPAYPGWSIDDRIVFNTYDLRTDPVTTEASNIYTVAADGSDLRALTDYTANDDRATQPRWTPDGLGIVYTLVTRVASDPFGERHLAYMDADGNNARLLTPEPIVGTHPELRPIPTL